MPAGEMATVRSEPLAERHAKFVRVFSTAEGESQFEDVSLDRTLPPGDGMYVLHRLPASEARLLLASAHWTPINPTASRRYLVILQGSFAVQTSDRVTRKFAPGDVVLLEDVTGKGHRTRGRGLAMVVLLDTTRA